MRFDDASLRLDPMAVQIGEYVLVGGAAPAGIPVDADDLHRAGVPEERNSGRDRVPLASPRGRLAAMVKRVALLLALAGLLVSELRIFDTDRAKAEHLAALLKAHRDIRIADSIEDALSGAVGVVNGTPVGMLPSRATPVPEALLRRDLWVADAVYSPLWTPLLTAAKAKGAKVMTGRELAIYQAADAFELFTGLTPSTVEMGNAFDAVIAKRYAATNAA